MLDMTKYTTTESKDNEIIVNGARFMVTDSVASKVMELVQNSKTPKTLKVEEPTVEVEETVEEEELVDIFSLDFLESTSSKGSGRSSKGYDTKKYNAIIKYLKAIGAEILYDNCYCTVAKRDGVALLFISGYKSYGIKTTAKDNFGAKWVGKDPKKAQPYEVVWAFPSIKNANAFIKHEKEYEKNRESK